MPTRAISSNTVPTSSGGDKGLNVVDSSSSGFAGYTRLARTLALERFSVAQQMGVYARSNIVVDRIPDAT